MLETTQESKPLMQQGKNTSQKKSLVLLLIGIVILVAIIVFLVITIFTSSIKGNDWYAVFLTNGRTYFGHVINENSQTISLKDIYYLQVQQSNPTKKGEKPKPKITLVSNMDDFYGPAGEMQISRVHILYVQKLRESSQIVAMIKKLAKK